MKRNRFTTLLTFILVTSLAFCLVACSGDNTTPEAPSSESSTSSTSQETSPVQTDSASSTGTSSTDVSTTAASTDAVTTSTAQLPSNGASTADRLTASGSLCIPHTYAL